LAVVVGTPKASLLSLMAAWLVRVPIRVYVLRGLRLEGATGVRRYLLRWTEKICFFLCSSAVVNSPSLLGEAKHQGLTRRRNAVVLGAGSSKGVDVDWYVPSTVQSRNDSRSAMGLQSNELVVAFVGRLHRDKGIATLFRAIEFAWQSDPSIRLVLCGAKESGWEKESANCLEDPRIQVISHIPDVRPVYWGADLLCLPTLREGFPNVVLEAAATGLPAVVSDATGAIDSVVDGVTGIVCPVNDWEAFGEAILTLRSDHHLRGRMGKAARNRVEADFDSRLVIPRFVDFLDNERNALMSMSHTVKE